MRTTIAAIGLAVMVSSVSATGTALTQTLEPGMRVRIKLVSDAQAAVIGSLAAVQGDTLVFESEPGYYYRPGARRIRLDEVKSIDVSVGRRTQARKGMLVGGLAGATFGAALGYLNGDDEPAPCREGDLGCAVGAIFVEPLTSKAGQAAIGGVTFGVVGVALGGLIGLASPTDNWRPVSQAKTYIAATKCLIAVSRSVSASRPAGFSILVTLGSGKNARSAHSIIAATSCSSRSRS